MVPGLPKLPAAGEFYASPALSQLLATVPADELAARFPGTAVGTIGAAGLRSPDELAIVIGRSPTELEALPRTIRVSRIQTAPRGLSTSQFYQFGFALGAAALAVPMLILIGTATRMAAGRREERYAAMRLVGATRMQISVVASVEAVVGAAFGAIVGLGLNLAIQPLLGELPLLGYRFSPTRLPRHLWGTRRL
jgi:hypothetical protein